MLYSRANTGEYTPEFEAFLRRIPQRKFNTKAEWIDKVILPMGVFDADRIHNPVVVPVKTSYNTVNYTGVRLAPWRKDWFDQLQRGVGEMMGVRNYAQVDLRDVHGKSLRDMTMSELRNVREARVYNGADQVLVANPPEPPVSISPIKEQTLRRIVHTIQTDVESLVGDTLKGTKTYPDLADRLRMTNVPEKVKGGALEQAIRDYLGEIIDDDFIASYADSEYAHNVAPNHVVDDLTYLLMRGILASVSTSTDEVENCMAIYNNANGLLGFGPKQSGGARSKPTQIDEFRVYQQIGNHGVFQHNMRPDMMVVMKHGYPERKHHSMRCSNYAHKHHRQHPHLGPHHHVTGHVHHKRKVVSESHNTKPLTLHPYSHPVHNSPFWWYGDYPHAYYTKGAGAEYRDRHTSSQFFNSGGDARVAAQAMHKPYRGDERKVMEAFYKYAGYAPCPTKSLLDKLAAEDQAPAAVTEEMAIGEQAEAIGKKPFAYGLRLKYLRYRLKRAEQKGDEDKAQKYRDLIEKLKDQRKDSDAAISVDALVRIAAEEALEEGGSAIPEAYAAIAYYFTPIACDMCDKYMLEKKIRDSESKRRAAHVTGDDARARKFAERKDKLQRKYKARTGATLMSVGAALKTSAQMANADRMRAVAEVLTNRAELFDALCKPQMTADGKSVAHVGHQVTQVAIDALCRFALKEGTGIAEQFLDDMVTVDNASNVEAQSFWMNVRTAAEPYLRGDLVPVELGIEEAMAIEGRYAGTKRAARALHKAFDSDDTADAASAITEDDALLAYLNEKLQQGSLSPAEERKVLRIVTRLNKTMARGSARRNRSAFYAARRRQRQAGRSDKARDRYFSSTGSTGSVNAEAVAAAALPDSDEELLDEMGEPIGVIIDSRRAMSRLEKVLKPEDFAALQELDTDAAANQFLTELDYDGEAEAVILDYTTKYNKRMAREEKRRRRGYRAAGRAAKSRARSDKKAATWKQKLRELNQRNSATAMGNALPTGDHFSDEPELPLAPEDEYVDTFGGYEYTEDRGSTLYPSRNDQQMRWLLEQERQARRDGDSAAAEGYAKEYEQLRRGAMRDIRNGGAPIFSPMTKDAPSMVVDKPPRMVADAPKTPKTAGEEAGATLKVGNKTLKLPPGFKTYAQIKAEMEEAKRSQSQ